MNTETLDKIYLEWSQFTSARTERENVTRITLEQLKMICHDDTLDLGDRLQRISVLLEPLIERLKP